MGGLGLNKHKPDEGFMRAAMAASDACLESLEKGFGACVLTADVSAAA